MKKIVVFCLFVTISTLSHAQLTITSTNKILFGDVDSIGSYTSNWYGWGQYFSYKTDRFLKIMLSNSNPRISGTGECVVFYDSEESVYNDIQVRTVYETSDERLKTDIKSVDNGINKVMSLKPVSFAWKKPIKFETTSKSSQRQMGFLAQDVETVLPELVTEDEEGNKLVNYSGIIPVLTSSIQELEEKIKVLQKEVDSLKEKTN